MANRLYRSRESSVIAGVCGGLGEYFDIDPVFFRIVMVLLVFASGFGLLAYVVAMIAVPRRPLAEPSPPTPDSGFAKYLPGVILIGLGLIFLANNLFWWFKFKHIWPVALIAAGILLIWSTVNRRQKKGEAHESVQS